MTFQEALAQYGELCRRYHTQQLTQAQFCQEVDRLRLQDARGGWWQLSYEGQWLRWNGAQWTPSTPEEPVRAASAPQPPPAGRPAGVEKMAGALRPLAGKSERWWSVLSILGGGVGGGLWYGYSTLDKGAKPDLVTALIMLAVPVVLVLCRRPLDRLLAGLQPLRRRLPPLLIVGIGLAVPYLTATYLYDSVGLSEYPYIRWTVFLGPLLSYLVIRTPQVPLDTAGGQRRRDGHL